MSLPVALLTLLLLGGAEGIDKGELECEEAVKHLVDCCPDNAPAKAIDCYAGRGCDHRPPDLSAERALCLRDARCNDLYASGACQTPKSACLP